MTAAADLVLTNAEVHTLGRPDETAEAVAARDGEIVRVGSAYDVEFLADVDTTVRNLDGRVVLPGFVDAHTHLAVTGRYAIHADLRDAPDPEACVERLRDDADRGGDWILGYGFDESAWPRGCDLHRDALDRVSEDRPVVAFREDLHAAAVNGVVFERLGDRFPDGDVDTVDGEPNGRVVEGAVDAIVAAIDPTPGEARRLVAAARDEAHRRGVTSVHDMVRRASVARAVRDLARDGDLDLRVRLNYRHDRLDDAMGLGLRSNHGGAHVTMGATKAFVDGSLGARTAKLAAPYADADTTGRWVERPGEVDTVVSRAAAAGNQVALHAIGDRAVTAALDAFEATSAPGEARHRVEHAELATDADIERLADLDVIASVQPNFHKWAGDGGLYERRLGERWTRTNRLGDLADAGVRLAFGSDGMPFDPLVGLQHAVNAPTPAQRLDVTDALRAYTRGSAYAGFAEDRVGRIRPGMAADLVALDGSPWADDTAIDSLGVALTVVGGRIVHDALGP